MASNNFDESFNHGHEHDPNVIALKNNLPDPRSINESTLSQMLNQTKEYAISKGYFHINTTEHKLNIDEIQKSSLSRVSKDILFSVKKINYITTPIGYLLTLIISHFNGTAMSVASGGQIVVLNNNNKVIGFINRKLVVNVLLPFQLSMFDSICKHLFESKNVSDCHGKVIDFSIIPTAYFLITSKMHVDIIHQLRLSSLCLVKDVICSHMLSKSVKHIDVVKVSLVGNRSDANQIRLNDIQISNVFRPIIEQPNIVSLSNSILELNDIEEDNFSSIVMPSKKKQATQNNGNKGSFKSNTLNNNNKSARSGAIPKRLSNVNDKSNVQTPKEDVNSLASKMRMANIATSLPKRNEEEQPVLVTERMTGDIDDFDD